MNLELRNKKAIVCGSTQGIGKAIAISLAREGAEVIINYSSSLENANKVVFPGQGSMFGCVQKLKKNLEKKIKDDVSILKMIGKIANTFDADARRLQLLEMIREYEYVITSEVDLKKEAGNTIQTAKFFED